MMTSTRKEIIIKNDKFPTYYIPSNKPSKKMIIFVPGLNGNGVLINYFNEEICNDFHLFSFDGRAQAENKSKPYRSYKKFLKDIDAIVDYVKDEYNVDEIYLTGESWGAGLCLLYDHIYGKVKKVFCWNCPKEVVNTSKQKFKDAFVRNIKMLCTFLFSINTYDNQDFVDELTNNKVLLRTIKIYRNKKLSNKVILAAWRSFKPAWKVIEKKLVNNFRYIQSGDDILFNKARIDEIKSNINIIYYEHGTHILSFDNLMSKQLFSDLIKFFTN